MIKTANIETELGTMIAGATEDGICLLEFGDRKILGKEYRDLEKYFNTTIQEGKNEYFNLIRMQLSEYFEGSRKEFKLPLITPGSPFQKSVWNELLSIPYGSTRSYLEQSIALGNPDSIRAVAHANGMNRIAIIIPCHRVIGSDGSLTGYGGGIKRKKWLLDHERKHSGKSIELSLF
jgi:AraC family transcriptional regulator of adaptative response/methylated-DNA-[protein]-cysteine methyltransferase